MDNLIGADVDRWPELVAEPGAHLHLYGKGEARPGRKMGHVTGVRPAAYTVASTHRPTGSPSLSSCGFTLRGIADHDIDEPVGIDRLRGTRRRPAPVSARDIFRRAARNNRRAGLNWSMVEHRGEHRAAGLELSGQAVDIVRDRLRQSPPRSRPWRPKSRPSICRIAAIDSPVRSAWTGAWMR